MSDKLERLEDLADTLLGDEWNYPITARDDVLWAVEEIRSLRYELRQAKRRGTTLERTIATLYSGLDEHWVELAENQEFVAYAQFVAENCHRSLDIDNPPV